MELRQHHKEELRAQMAANEERQKREHAEYLLEGEKTRQKLQAEKDFIEVSAPILLCLCDSKLACCDVWRRLTVQRVVTRCCG